MEAAQAGSRAAGGAGAPDIATTAATHMQQDNDAMMHEMGEEEQSGEPATHIDWEDMQVHPEEVAAMQQRLSQAEKTCEQQRRALPAAPRRPGLGGNELRIQFVALCTIIFDNKFFLPLGHADQYFMVQNGFHDDVMKIPHNFRKRRFSSGGWTTFTTFATVWWFRWFFWGQSVVNVVNVVGGCGVWKCAF